MHLKTSSAKWRLFRLDLNELKRPLFWQVSLAVACPSKDDIIMQVAACESGINKPQQFTMDTRITFCE